MIGRKHASAAAAPDAGPAVRVLCEAHYQSLVRLAALLAGDRGTAEEVVQDAFVAMHRGGRRRRGTGTALCYLRRSAVRRSRPVPRRRAAGGKHAQKRPPDAPGAEQRGAPALLEGSAVAGALRGLPARQREALVLRYYADLSDAGIATVIGIRRGAVQRHIARGMSALQAILEQQP
jgi:RNA polymerase sigma-70 factor (sigma-E family)